MLTSSIYHVCNLPNSALPPPPPPSQFGRGDMGLRCICVFPTMVWPRLRHEDATTRSSLVVMACSLSERSFLPVCQRRRQKRKNGIMTAGGQPRGDRERRSGPMFYETSGVRWNVACVVFPFGEVCPHCWRLSCSRSSRTTFALHTNTSEEYVTQSSTPQSLLWI